MGLIPEDTGGLVGGMVVSPLTGMSEMALSMVGSFVIEYAVISPDTTVGDMVLILSKLEPPVVMLEVVGAIVIGERVCATGALVMGAEDTGEDVEGAADTGAVIVGEADVGAVDTGEDVVGETVVGSSVT